MVMFMLSVTADYEYWLQLPDSWCPFVRPLFLLQIAQSLFKETLKKKPITNRKLEIY